MHTIADVFFWRMIFMLAMIGVVVIGLVGWKAGAWVVQRLRTVKASGPSSPTMQLRQSRA
jgi:hypothetical protein